MARPFASGPVTIALDAIRALAALMVLVGHLVQLGLYTGYWPFTYAFQHVAVIVFFVLSGLVIASSHQARQPDLKDYVAARVARIMPTAVIAVALGAACFWIATAFGLDVPQPPGHDRVDVSAIVLPLLFLSESGTGTGPAWNPPFWSLCFEVWYYAMFGAAIYLTGRKRWIVLAVMALAAGPRIVMLAPVWLCGVWLARTTRIVLPTPRLAIAILAGCVCLIVWLADISIGIAEALPELAGIRVDLRHAEYVLTDWLSAPLVVIAFVAIKALAERFAPMLERAKPSIAILSGSSFTLYALHWPVHSLMAGLGISVGSPLGLLGLVAVQQAAAIAVSRLTDDHQGRLRAALRQRLAGAPTATPLAA